MKKFIFLITILISIFDASLVYADYNKAGFYRLQNFKSKRFGNMIHDTGSMGSDYHSIQMLEDNSQFTEPGSVIYVSGATSRIVLYGAGTSTYQIVGKYINLKSDGVGDLGTKYTASGTVWFVTANLEDQGGDGFDHGTPSDTYEYQRWYLHPIDTDGSGSEYFGVAPTYSIGGKYYTTIRLSFSVNLSENVHAFIMSDDGKITEIFSTIPANTPFIVQCASDNPSDNRLFPVAKGGTYSTESTLSVQSGLYKETKYNYFKTNAPNAARNGNYTKGQNYAFGTELTPDLVPTLRTLTVKDGKLGFIETFASVYQTDLCINGEMAYFDLATNYNDVNGGMTIVETPTITIPTETEALVGETLTFNATFASKDQRPNIKLQYSLDGENWIETTGAIDITSEEEKEGTIYVRTYNGGIASDVVTANYSFVSLNVNDLAGIVSNGTVGKYYDVTEVEDHYLYGAKVVGNTLYAKDYGRFRDPDTKPDGAIDGMSRFYNDPEQGIYYNQSDYDQSNWVAVSGLASPSAFEKKYIHVKKGKLVNRVNPEMKVANVADIEVKGTMETNWAPNSYCPASFMETTQVGADGKTYFFVKPKPQEVVHIVGAIYGGKDEFGKGKFYIDKPGNGYNLVQLKGGFVIDSSSGSGFVEGFAYEFDAVVKKAEQKSSTLGSRHDSEPYTEGGVSNEYVVYPFSSPVVTGVQSLENTGKVVGVKYYNAMGVESDVPFNGINIVVTTYDNGTRTTSKILK